MRFDEGRLPGLQGSRPKSPKQKLESRNSIQKMYKNKPKIGTPKIYTTTGFGPRKNREMACGLSPRCEDINANSCGKNILSQMRPKITGILCTRRYYSISDLINQFKSHVWSIMESLNGAIFHAANPSILEKLDSCQRHFLQHIGTDESEFFGMVEIYNKLPQAFIDSKSVCLFQQKLTAVARAQCVNHDPKWRFTHDPRFRG